MSDDLDALLAQADNADIGLCDDLAAAVRTLRADYDTALNVINRHRDFILAYTPHFIHEGFVDHDDLAALNPANEDIWTDAERAVLAAAETRHTLNP